MSDQRNRTAVRCDWFNALLWRLLIAPPVRMCVSSAAPPAGRSQVLHRLWKFIIFILKEWRGGKFSCLQAAIVFRQSNVELTISLLLQLLGRFRPQCRLTEEVPSRSLNKSQSKIYIPWTELTEPGLKGQFTQIKLFFSHLPCGLFLTFFLFFCYEWHPAVRERKDAINSKNWRRWQSLHGVTLCHACRNWQEEVFSHLKTKQVDVKLFLLLVQPSDKHFG